MQRRQKISLLVTDLDNTLYDWVSFFAVALSRMIDVAAEMLDIQREQLLDDIQAVHKRYHDSEHPFAILEAESVRARLGGQSRREMKRALQPAFDAFNDARDRHLQLYPLVRETLTSIAASGAIIVGHTEANIVNALFRLRKLDCISVFTRLFALEHTGDEHPEPEKALKYREHQSLVHTLRHHQRKPNPSILQDICRSFRVSPSDTLYVGDSLTRDIGMAKEAGVWSAYAQYGTQFARAHWQTLVRVTHWTPEDVRRNEEARLRYHDLKPDVVLSDSLAQILDSFEFVKPSSDASTTSLA